MPNPVYSIVQLKQMLDAFWFENTNRSINGTDPNTWLKAMLDSCCAGKKIISGITAVGISNINLSTLKTGDVLGGKTLATGNMIFAPNQLDASENGLYIVGAIAGETERHLDFLDAASLNGYLLVLDSPQVGIGPYFYATTDSGDGMIIESADLSSYAQKWVPLTPTTDFTPTPASTSTITMSTDQTANIKAGMAAKYKIGGVYYYGYYVTVASGLLTIGGIPLSGDIQELYYSPLAGSVDMFAIGLAGACLAAASTTLIETTNKQKVKWDKQAAYCVGFSGWVRVDDSGATQANVNVLNSSGNPVCNSNSGEGIPFGEMWSKTTINIDPANYLISNQGAIELSTDAIGSNGDAEDLTVQMILVYP